MCTEAADRDVGGLGYPERTVPPTCGFNREGPPLRVVHVIVDVPARRIDGHFDYLAGSHPVRVGTCVLVDLAGRPVVGYVVGLATESPHAGLKPVRAVLSGPLFDSSAVSVARWLAEEYLCPLSEALRLFLPPGGTPTAVRGEGGTWTLRRPDVGPVDARWVALTANGRVFVPRAGAHAQRAVLDALIEGPVRIAELAADLGRVDSTVRRLAELGAVEVTRRRRLRGDDTAARSAPRPLRLTSGQSDALRAIRRCLASRDGTVLLDGVTGSGKTEVYLRAIEDVLADGGSAIVLVPEISLTPQTVGRFRARFGDRVAVLHSRLAAGERFDQWDLARQGCATVVVGARSALFAPVAGLRLIIIDEEHESSYKQACSPRYHTRDVARRLAAETDAVLVVGSATPALETLHDADEGRAQRVRLQRRASGAPPSVTVVDMAAEFTHGNRSMYSDTLADALRGVRDRGEKAVLLLNRRGFASFLLCRECGHVPGCESCSTSLTFHEVGSRLVCHHCGDSRPTPPTCPACGSPYLRRFGAGTQRVEVELGAVVPGLPVVRMDADTTRGKGGHERRLAEFEGLSSGVLLGTQMIAKGLDYPEVTLAAVINADTTLRFPDFRAAERTWQMLEQVAGRAGRGDRPGQVIIQTYWPDHPAIRAVASRDRTDLVASERSSRLTLGFPPFGRLVNVLVTAQDPSAARDAADRLANRLSGDLPTEWRLLGPAPAPIAKLQGLHRWHLLLKGPPRAPVPRHVVEALATLPRGPGVTVAADVDPQDMA